MKNENYDNLRVAIRVRPPLNRETEEGIPFRSIAIVSEDHKSISLAEYLGSEFSELERQRQWIEEPNLFQLHRFTFDSIFDMDSLQEDVYNITAKQAVQSVLEGYNSTIFCYGQTGTGKTYTMEGFTYDSNNPNRGIIQRTIQDIFNYIEMTSNENTKFIIRASFLQIYNENISDLLKPDKKNLQIREDKKKGIYVDLLSEWAVRTPLDLYLSEWAVRTPLDLYALLKRGGNLRATSATYMNDVSSRSHAVFVITVEQMTTELNVGNKTQIKVGKLNLVDLAGSERIRITGTTGQQLEESKKINKSLLCLGNVINALTDKKGKSYIPYRDSKLTRLLQDSLGGNCKTTMIAMISPSQDSFSESLSTLYFAQRAKKIKNRPIINEDANNRALIRKYENELKNLKNELELKNKLLKNNGLVMQLQEEKEQALQDKNEAIRELEKASKQYLIEREEKLKLEKKIQMMSEQMITGGHKIEETPQFQNALKNQLKLYENKILEIEKERQQLEEDKAENKEYKELLMKQRDIMNALTYKLNERDEHIAQLQEELESTEKNEQGLRNRVQFLENILTEKKIPFLIDNYNYNNINNFKKNNAGNFSSSYLPYEAETNSKQFEGRPIIMLSSKEKINELRSIISEQENKIHFLDLVSQKFINTMNHDGKIDINKLLSQMETSKDLYQKINKLQKENEKLKMEINEQNNYINNINLNAQKNNSNNTPRIDEFKSDLITMLDNSINNTEGSSMQSELIKIYKFVNNYPKSNNTSNQINSKTNTNISNNIDNNNFDIYSNSNNKINDTHGINMNNNYVNNINNNENIPKPFFNEKYDKFNLMKKLVKADNIDNNTNNYNFNYNLNNINNMITHKKSSSTVNTNKYNSIKGISFTPYIQKPINVQKNESNNIFKKINNNNENKNIQYLSEKIPINDPRLKNKKYINKFINSNINNE